MSQEFDPLVRRVDALLRRHQQHVEEVHAGTQADERPAHREVALAPAAPLPGGVPDREEDIPVLTEIVDPEAVFSAPAEDLRGDALVQHIERAVMEKLMVELDRALDQRLGRTITDLLEQVLHGLRAELSVGVRQMVREAVAAAIAKEIAERLSSE